MPKHGGDRITSAAPGQAAEIARPAPAPDEEPKATRGAIIATLASFIVAGIALPIVLALGGPLNGWVLGVALWFGNWAVQLATAKHALRMGQTAAVGVTGISFVVRAWVVAGILFITALKYDKNVALVAAAVFLAAFTADLIGRGMAFAISEKNRPAPQPAPEDAE